MTSRTRRAGRSIGAAVLAFALGQLALDFALESARPEWRDPEFGWRIKALRAIDESRCDRPLILAFGSSRTQMGLSPNDLGLGGDEHSPIVYNFGQAGGGPIQTLLNVRRVLDAGIEPNAILVEIMPATLSYHGTSETFYHDTVARLNFADLRRLDDYCASPNRLAFRWLATRVLPWHSLRFLLLSHWQPTLLPWQKRIDFQWRLLDSRGWARFPFDSIDAEFRAAQTDRARQEYEGNLRNFEVSAISDRILRDLVALGRREGIAVSFYLMPEAPTFRAWMSPASREKLDAYLGSLSRELNVPIFDASAWLPDEAFADGHHLLPSAAKRFSARFGREFLRLRPNPRD